MEIKALKRVRGEVEREGVLLGEIVLLRKIQ